MKIKIVKHSETSTSLADAFIISFIKMARGGLKKSTKNIKEWLRGKGMKQITITVFDELEMEALETLYKAVCPSSVHGDCLKCPFHLNGNVLLNSGRRTACLSTMCGDVLRKG